MKAIVVSMNNADFEAWANAGWDVVEADSVSDAKSSLSDADLLVCSRGKLALVLRDLEQGQWPPRWCDIALDPSEFHMNSHMTAENALGIDADHPLPAGYPDAWPTYIQTLFTDTSITGLWKREMLFAWIDAEQQNPSDEPYHIAFLDANDLKKTNDAHGHEAGNQLLRDIADTIKETLADEHGIVVRWLSGDEYVALWRGGITGKDFYHQFDQKARAKQVSASIGTVELSFSDLSDIDTHIKAADELMLRDKKRRKAGRDYIGRPSVRQRLLGVGPKAPGPIERQDVNSPVLWVWSQDAELQKSVEDVALAVSWALAEGDVAVTLAAIPSAEWHKRLRIPSAMFTDGHVWHHPNGLWSAVITDTISSALFNPQDPQIIVALGRETPPPSDVVDINIVKDRVTSGKVMVTFAGKTTITGTAYPATLAGRPDEQWLNWASDVVRPMLPGLHRFL